MKVLALRFSDNYAPEEGTIRLHEELINEYGFVWYGKFGNKIKQSTIDEMMDTEDPKFLMIKSGKADRYWAHFSEVSYEDPELKYIPEYYRNNHGKVGCWFKITEFEKADSKVMSLCTVISSGQPLSQISKHCMSPTFIVEYKEEEK